MRELPNEIAEDLARQTRAVLALQVAGFDAEEYAATVAG